MKGKVELDLETERETSVYEAVHALINFQNQIFQLKKNQTLDDKNSKTTIFQLSISMLFKYTKHEKCVSASFHSWKSVNTLIFTYSSFFLVK